MKILASDDPRSFRAGLCAALHELDAELVEASTCEEALELVARDGDIDLVLLDLGLPGMDGSAGLRALSPVQASSRVAILPLYGRRDPDDLPMPDGIDTPLRVKPSWQRTFHR
jgi:DNA-binding response OmpR family regulator